MSHTCLYIQYIIEYFEEDKGVGILCTVRTVQPYRPTNINVVSPLCESTAILFSLLVYMMYDYRALCKTKKLPYRLILYYVLHTIDFQ